MHILFRVDASKKIGYGHAMRCLTLAEGLRDKGAVVEFITRPHLGNLNEYINSRGFKFYSLSTLNLTYSQQNLSVYGQLLGVSQDTDADETIKVIKKITQPDWLVIDNYALDDTWEKQLRPYVNKIMVIDDLANRNHECDLLLDQNLFEDLSVRYQKRVSEGCVQLLGPQYALLQPEYSQLHKNAKPRRQPLKNLLVFFGGIDQHDLTGLTLAALRNVNMSFDSVDVVVSRQSENYNKIKNQVDNSLNMQLHSDLPSLAHLMMKADFSVGAGGSTNWERLCLGLPSLVVTLAENQKPVSRSLHNMGLIQWIGDVESIQLDCIKSAVEKIVFIKKIYDWSEHCINVCSGDGVNNVIDKLLPTS